MQNQLENSIANCNDYWLGENAT